MKKKSNVVLFILGTFLIGNICLLCSYIFIYVIAGADAYANEIMKLTDIRILLYQILFSGLNGFSFSLLLVILYSLIGKPTYEKIYSKNLSIKNLTKICITCLGKLMVVILIWFAITEICTQKNIFSDNLNVGYALFEVISLVIGSIFYITVKSTEEFNKKLEKKKLEKLNNN